MPEVTLFTISMSLISSSILIIVFYFFRKRFMMSGIMSVSGMLLLYMVTVVRIAVPIEMPWTSGIAVPWLFNAIVRFLSAPATQIHQHLFTIGQLFLIIWLFIAVLLLLHLFFQYCRAGNSFRDIGFQENDSFREMLVGITENSSMSEKIHIGTLNGINTPVSIGILHRYIVLPTGDHYTPEDYQNMIRHEYTHFMNRDLTVKLLIKILCAIFWWNPFVWLLQKDLEQIQEIHCDQTVLKNVSASGIKSYLQTIVKVLGHMRANDFPEMAPVFPDELHLLYNKPIAVKERFEIIEHFHTKIDRGRRNQISGYILFFTMIVLSYSFVFQSAFELDISEIETDENTFQIDLDKDQLIEYDDGSYAIRRLDGTEIPIPKGYYDYLSEP